MAGQSHPKSPESRIQGTVNTGTPAAASIGARLVLDCSSIVPRLFLDCSSIVPRLFLDCSSIVPLLLAGFAARCPENHRWPQMNTDCAEWASVLFWYSPGFCPPSGFPPC